MGGGGGLAQELHLGTNFFFSLFQSKIFLTNCIHTYLTGEVVVCVCGGREGERERRPRIQFQGFPRKKKSVAGGGNYIRAQLS